MLHLAANVTPELFKDFIKRPPAGTCKVGARCAIAVGELRPRVRDWHAADPKFSTSARSAPRFEIDRATGRHYISFTYDDHRYSYLLTPELNEAVRAGTKIHDAYHSKQIGKREALRAIDALGDFSILLYIDPETATRGRPTQISYGSGGKNNEKRKESNRAYTRTVTEREKQIKAYEAANRA